MNIEPSPFPAARLPVNPGVLEAPGQSPVRRYSFGSKRLARDGTGELSWTYIGGERWEWSSQRVKSVNGNMWDNYFTIGRVRNFSGYGTLGHAFMGVVRHNL